MQITITINIAEIARAQGATQQVIKNLGVGVPTAILNMLKTTAKTAQGLTHVGATKRLQGAWKVQQQKFNFSLYNMMPYAAEEFGRGGEKVSGNPPHGPHNIIPILVDMVTGNVESVVAKAIYADVTR